MAHVKKVIIYGTDLTFSADQVNKLVCEELRKYKDTIYLELFPPLPGFYVSIEKVVDILAYHNVRNYIIERQDFISDFNSLKSSEKDIISDFKSLNI